jgi:hypothetical protein
MMPTASARATTNAATMSVAMVAAIVVSLFRGQR